MLSRFLAFSWFLCATMSDRVGYADTVEPVRLSYRASAGCPSRDDFVRELEARTPRVKVTEDGKARAFRVELESRPRGASGKLIIEDSEHPELRRSLMAANCREAARALSFIAASAIDPDATPPPPEDEAVAPARASVTPEATSRVESESSARSALRSPRGVWSAGGGLDVLGLSAPSAVFAPRLFIDWSSMRDSSFSPSARISVVRTLDSKVSSDDTTTSFVWTAARVELCPLRLGSKIALVPCALGEIGAVGARASGADRVEDRTRVWAAAGASARLAWTIHRWLVLEALIGSFAPLTREDFVYRPSTYVYRPPPLAVFGGLSGAVRW